MQKSCNTNIKKINKSLQKVKIRKTKLPKVVQKSFDNIGIRYAKT
jgi:hypothetical protein